MANVFYRETFAGGEENAMFLTATGYGLLSGFFFFVYLAWFRHVRDTVPAGIGRRLYYLAIAVTFVIIGRVTGISVIFGLLPMLLILQAIPEKEWGWVGVCSLGFALATGLWLYANLYAALYPVEEKPKITFVAPPAKPERTEPTFDPDKYFVSDAIDPDMEFERIDEVEAGELRFKLPVPKGYTYTTATRINEYNVSIKFYSFKFSNSNGEKFSLSIPDNWVHIKGDYNEQFRLSRSQYVYDIYKGHDGIVSMIIESIKKSGALPGNNTTTIIEQNTKDSLLIFDTFDYTIGKKDNQIGYFLQCLMGTILLKNYITQPIIMSSGDNIGNKRNMVSFINKLLYTNN